MENIDPKTAIMFTDGLWFLGLFFVLLALYWFRRTTHRNQENQKKVNAELERVLAKGNEQEEESEK